MVGAQLIIECLINGIERKIVSPKHNEESLGATKLIFGSTRIIIESSLAQPKTSSSTLKIRVEALSTC